MREIRSSDVFDKWLTKLRDDRAVARIITCGGNKATQQEDIANAREIARLYDEE